MINNKQKIKCPECSKLISIDDVLTHQIEEKIKKKFENTQKIKEKELAQKEEELKEAFKKAKEQGAIMGGKWFEEK